MKIPKIFTQNNFFENLKHRANMKAIVSHQFPDAVVFIFTISSHLRVQTKY